MAYIKREFIDKIIDVANIVEVIRDFVDLKPAGSNYKGLSPFVKEKSPSFMVSPVKDMFKDFSSGKGGNVVTFLMEKLPCNYTEAIEYLAQKYNYPVEYESAEYAANKAVEIDLKEKQSMVLKNVYKHYLKSFLELPHDHPAKLEVQQKRKYSLEQIEDWGIAYAPENSIYDMLKNTANVEIGRNIGLLSSKENSNFEMHSNRIVYPIHDKQGFLIGLASRDLSGNKKMSKWINPPVSENNKLYNKSKVFFGLNRAIKTIRTANEVWIVEGYNDVIAWQDNGILNTVAPCGTAITDGQLNELKKYCSNIVICLDPDNAGKEAALKTIPKMIKLGFRVRVLKLQSLDPDDFVRANKDNILQHNGSLLELFNSTPGIIVDAFSLLINKHVKSSYIEFEEKIEAKELEINSVKEKLAEITKDIESEKEEVLNSISQLNKTLADAEVTFGKKSDEYKKAKIDINDLTYRKNNIYKNTDYIKLKEDIEFLEGDRNYLMKNLTTKFEHSVVERTSGAKELFDLVCNIDDDLLKQIYFNAILSESKVNKNTFNSWLKVNEKAVIQNYVSNSDLNYILPLEVKEHLDVHLKDIEEYGMFMSGNKIYMKEDPLSDGKVYFTCKSNFMIQVLQHMNDEKFPKKLIRMKNIYNKEVIYDAPSENLNTPQAFDNTVTSHGNFRFDGNRTDLLTLRTYLFDKMGNGKKIDVLGWQPDARIWVWNNRVVNDKGENVEIDGNGVFVHNEIHYYVPSANKIYQHNSSKYKPQKQFIVIDSKIPFTTFMEKVYKVHREHAISGLLFAVSSLFQDLIAKEAKAFPILFLYGPGSSGKDGLARVVQSFLGIPQAPISLESGASTLKAQIREFAQFRNGIGQLSEYYAGDGKLDGMVKGLWDRNGYKRGNIESAVATDSIDIDSSTLMTGNQYPNREALITRLIWNEMDKVVFSDEENQNYDECNDMTDAGVSGYANNLLAFRNKVEASFSKEYRFHKNHLGDTFKDLNPKARMIQNLAVLAAIYKIFRDEADVHFPFSQTEMVDHFKKQLKLQVAKMNTASIMVRFWSCFITSLRGHKDDRLQVGHIVNVEGNSLYFNWTHTISKIERQWWIQYREAAPDKNTLKEELSKNGFIIANHSKYSFDKGREANRTSAVEINLLALNDETKEDIVGSIMFQKGEGSLFPAETPETHTQGSTSIVEEVEELPFSD